MKDLHHQSSVAYVCLLACGESELSVTAATVDTTEKTLRKNRAHSISSCGNKKRPNIARPALSFNKAQVRKDLVLLSHSVQTHRRNNSLFDLARNPHCSASTCSSLRHTPLKYELLLHTKTQIHSISYHWLKHHDSKLIYIRNQS